jgi:hypothetical protein
MIATQQNKVAQPSVFASKKIDPDAEVSSDKLAWRAIEEARADCPTTEGYRHAWIGPRAFKLIVIEGLDRKAANKQLLIDTRKIPKERNIVVDIDEAIRTAIQKRDGITLPRGKYKKTPKFSRMVEREIEKVSAQLGKFNYNRLCAESPVTAKEELTASVILLQLFHPEMLVCCGEQTTYPGRILPAKNWARSRLLAASMSLVVPSPMLAQFVYDANGKKKLTPSKQPSVRLLENVGERRYLITEFDKEPPDFDEQARLIYCLAGHMPLVLVVNSAGKSLHSYFNCVGQSEHRIESFFDRACKLGADVTKWTLNGWVRLPGGWRDEWKHGKHIVGRQEVIYFDPRKLPI